MQSVDPRWSKSIALTALIIVSVFGWLAMEIPRGILSSSGDELLTAERSREMLLLGREEVHYNFNPSFQKPPLQYLADQFDLPRFNNRTLAVRIWPWFFGVLTAISIACWRFFSSRHGRG